MTGCSLFFCVRMSIRVSQVVGLAGGLAVSVTWIYALISNKFSDILQEIMFAAFDQFEFYVIILLISAFAFSQFQSVYINYSTHDGVIDRLELFGIKLIGIVSVIIIPALAGVLAEILRAQSNNSELNVFELIFIGLIIIIYIFIFSSQVSINEEKLQYADRRFIARRLIHM